MTSENQPLSQTQWKEELVKDTIDLYQSHPTERAYRFFSEDVTFEDPLTIARGIGSFRSTFNSLPKVFSKSEVLSHRIAVDSSSLLKLVMQVRWTFPVFHKSAEIEHHLYLHHDGSKVTKLEDRWKDEPLPDRSKHPAFGSLLEAWRDANARLLHLMFPEGAPKVDEPHTTSS
eukprot:TRINITY_DN5953_c0_g1_i2.p1 TRINITY_DN5953_c0_g1~~TRINITY_DN5953_c0_g1_i2.p1  ORF type:complete len:173 (+),score=11.70 TRINITY_DN5953_c0_g1_i2:294-812(+)